MSEVEGDCKEIVGFGKGHAIGKDDVVADRSDDRMQPNVAGSWERVPVHRVQFRHRSQPLQLVQLRQL